MSKFKVDFTGVESFTRAEEGQHVAKLVSIEEGTTLAGDAKLSAKFEITSGNSKGCTVYENFVLTPKALWKLKSFLDCVGVKADGKQVLDAEKLVGKSCIIEIADNEYNGKISSKIQAYKKLSMADVAENSIDDEWED